MLNKIDYLLKFLDTKYFRNNPEYIQKWQEIYHEHDKDIKILFLMKYKKISADYHWIYIELSTWFSLKDKPNISVYILEEALKNQVYDQSIIKNELEKYKEIKPCSPSEALRYLNPVSFTVFGKVWNEIRKVACYNEDIYKGNMSFEEYRLNKKRKIEDDHKRTQDKRICLYKQPKHEQNQMNQDNYNKMMCLYRQNNRINLFSHKMKSLTDQREDAPSNFLINLESALKFAPDLVKLSFLKDVLTLVKSEELLVSNIQDFYITKDFQVASSSKKDDLFDSEKCATCLISLFSEYLEISPSDFCIENVLYDISQVLRVNNMKIRMIKYQIFLYENQLINR
ncbi:uncharacterized protein VNE69_01339 [Vairimorpha necatrix]|uniref:Uncharacterized protein n=1 Tax=Vairimorpha necatrix TaxID=6039 RepID=A0AAX4J939_9MICR